MKNKALDANLDFDGMAGNGVNRAANKFAGNQSGLAMKERFGRGPTKGNASDSGIERNIGPSATKDKHKMTIATASQGGKINGGTTVKGFANPDSINVGMKK
jgi:hypothetical protein